ALRTRRRSSGWCAAQAAGPGLPCWCLPSCSCSGGGGPTCRVLPERRRPDRTTFVHNRIAVHRSAWSPVRSEDELQPELVRVDQPTSGPRGALLGSFVRVRVEVLVLLDEHPEPLRGP